MRIVHSVISGMYATVSALCLKIVLDKNGNGWKWIIACIGYGQYSQVYMAVLLIGLFIVFNLLMFHETFLGNQHSGAIIHTTVHSISTAILSAIVSWIFYDEQMTIKWLCGTSLMIGGVALIMSSKPDNKPKVMLLTD